MRPTARLARGFQPGWRDLDHGFLAWIALSLFVHGAAAAAASRAPRGEERGGTPADVLGFVAVVRPIDPAPLEDRRSPAQGVHAIIGSPVGEGAVAGDLLASGALDTDLMSVLAAVEGVRLPLPGERLTLRPTPPRPVGIYTFECGVDATGRRLCRCGMGRHPSAR